MLTAAQVTRLNRSNPEFQRAQPFTIIASDEQYGMVRVAINVTTDLSSRGREVIVPFAFEILDVTVQARANQNGGTFYMRANDDRDLFDGITCAVDKTITRAPTINPSAALVSAGSSIWVDADGGGERGLITIYGRRL